MRCIIEFSFPLINYFIFKNFQRIVRKFENERSFSFPWLVLITCSFKVKPIRNFSNWRFQSSTLQMIYGNADQGLTCNFKLVNLQLLILYSLFINLTCSTSNLLTVDADRLFVALNIFGVFWTIVFDILNVFWRDRAYCWSFSKKFMFYIVYGKMFFSYWFIF